jgi:hypothetical protein
MQRPWKMSNEKVLGYCRHIIKSDDGQLAAEYAQMMGYIDADCKVTHAGRMLSQFASFIDFLANGLTKIRKSLSAEDYVEQKSWF